MTDLRLDIRSLHEAYAAGLSPLTVVEAVYTRLAAVNDPGIFIHLAEMSDVLAQAKALPAFDPIAQPLWGIPFAVKDNIDVAGMPTTAACPAFAYDASADATAVARLRAAGALVVGKTNLDQFATGLVGVRTPYPTPRNAIDPSLVPGGSSSGSAVAVSHGVVSFSLGTDTAGSGRVPAGLNNIVGFKPTLGAISSTGMVPACRTLDTISLFALTVEDAYLAFSIAAAPDPADAYSRTIAAPPLAALPPTIKVGVPAREDRKFFGDSAMEAAFDVSLDKLESLGCDVVEIPFEDFYATADLLYGGAWVAERYAAVEDFMQDHESDMHPVTLQIISGARRLSAADAFRGLYALQGYKAKLAPTIASFDMICVPTAPRHYTVQEVMADPILTNSHNGTYTNFVNFLDMCGIAVPTGKRSDGLPMGVTLLATAGKDAAVAALAEQLHAISGNSLGATNWPLPEVKERGEEIAHGIELAVVGAHLSGMPLNSQLQVLGAKLCRTTRTTSAYRLYALAGQKVPKPGLLRVAESEGVSIEVEVWRLDPAGFGTFVAAIPPPLGIGTLELEDGSSCKGFLAEPAGLVGAVDISSSGGWRNYVLGSVAAA